MFKVKRCTKCHHDNSRKNNYCKKCGEDLISAKTKFSTKALVVMLLFIAVLGSGSVYAGAYYIKHKKVNQHTNDVTKTQSNNNVSTSPSAAKPYTCPDGTKSPSGGIINWDGSENCVPKSTPPVATTPKTTTPTPKSTPTPQTPPATTSTPESSSDDWYKYCLVDLEAATKTYQDSWDNYYADALIRHMEELDRLLASYTAQGLENSSFYQAAVISSNNSFHQSMDSAYQGFRKNMIDSTEKYACGPGELIREPFDQ